MNQHLTLNLGVRYEYTTIPLGEKRQTLNAIANTPSIIVPQVNEPLFFGEPQAPKNDYAPRIGFAYSPGSSGTTSIRAGFGMAYDTLYDNIGILAVPPQIGSTNNVNPIALTPTSWAAAVCPGGGSGITVLRQADALANTSNWVPPNVKYPVFDQLEPGRSALLRKNYTAEVSYVGTRESIWTCRTFSITQSLGYAAIFPTDLFAGAITGYARCSAEYSG